MDYEQFEQEVQDALGEEDNAKAMKFAAVVMHTLAEAGEPKHVKHLRDQLPKEAGELLHPLHEINRGTLQEFYNRVSNRADVRDYRTVKRQTKAVIGLLRSMMPGEMQDLLESLPAEYRPLYQD